MGKYLLGIDNGGMLSKAALYDLQGKEIAVSSCKTEFTIHGDGFTERNMEELWGASTKVIRDVIESSGINPENVVGVATTGHGNGMYLVDENGKSAYNGIISTDTRAKEYVGKWYGDGTFDRVFPKIMQTIWAGQPAALLAWFKEHNPEVLKKTKWVFMCKDYIRYRLTGEAYAEITDISGTSLMNIRDIKYDEDLLRELGLEDIRAKLPPIKYSSEICGYVTKEAANLTRLKDGTPVAGGLFDIDACAIATGVVDTEKLCVIAGTWSINEFITKTPIMSKDLFMSSIFAIKGYWLAMEGSPTSASNLEWFLTQFLGEENRLAKERNVSVFKLCDEMILGVKPEDSDIIFLPFLFGSNVGADAKACFINLNGRHTKAHILRSIYEGIVFSHLNHVNKLLAFRERPKSIRISGGASRSKAWVQIFADILETPIEVVQGTELGALGAAICAGVATGHFESFESAVQSMVKISYVCNPKQENREIYRKKYQCFKKVIELLMPLWDKN